MSKKWIITCAIILAACLVAGGYFLRDHQRDVVYRAALAEQAAYLDAHPEEAAAEAERIANLPPVVSPVVQYTPTPSGAQSGDFLFHEPTFEIDIAYPEQYVDALHQYSGQANGMKESCSSFAFSNNVECTYDIETLSGLYPLTVDVVTQHGRPSGEARVSVESGEVRVYMPFFGVYQYAVATPGHPVSIGGGLERHPQAAGDLGRYALWVETQTEEATGVQIEFRPTSEYEDFGE